MKAHVIVKCEREREEDCRSDLLKGICKKKRGEDRRRKEMGNLLSGQTFTGNPNIIPPLLEETQIFALCKLYKPSSYRFIV